MAVQHARAWHTATRVSAQQILLFGGEDLKEIQYNDVQIITIGEREDGADMTIREAKTSGKAPCSRINHAAAFLENSVYVYGGRNENGWRLDDLHSLRVQGGEPYVWTQVIFSGPNTPGL